MRSISRSLRRWGRYTLCGTLLAAGGLAQATPALPTSPTGALHVGKKMLDIISSVALDKLPRHIDVPPIQRAIYDCPGDAMALFISGAYVDIDPHSLVLTPASGALGIDGKLDVSGFAQVQIEKGYACIGTAACDVSFSFTGLAPSADISLSIQDGQPRASIGDVGLTVPDGGLHIELHNCVASLANGVIDSVAAKLLEMSQDMLGNKVREILPPLIEEKVASMLGISGAVGAYGFNAQLTDLSMTAQGIDAYAAIGVGYEGPAAACLPPDGGASPTPRNPTAITDRLSLPKGPTSSVVVGVSTDLITDALGAAWSSGLLCMDDAQVAKLGFDPAKIAALVPGLPPGLKLNFSMGMDAPPTIETDALGSIKMHVSGAELLLVMQVPGQETSGVAIATDFTLGVRPSVDVSSGTVYAELTDLSMDRMETHAGASGAAFDIDPERLVVLMHDLVLPMAAQRLRSMPLSPAAVGSGEFYAWLSEVSAHDNGVYVGLEPYRARPSAEDFAPPQTIVNKRPGHLVRAGLARYQVSGTDDLTPPQLLRYEWQVDDGPIAPPSFARVIDAPVTEPGSHTFRVRAVDLANTPATDWVSHTFELDPIPPTLTILERPPVAFRQTSAKVRFTGTDDRSAPNLMSFGYHLDERVPGGKLERVRASEPVGLEGGIGEIVVDDLVEGHTYELTVMLFDEAGNVTSKQIGFGAAAPGGCSLASSPARGDSLLSCLLIGLAIAWGTRRRLVASR